MKSQTERESLEWWYDLEISERENIERKYGYYGHDIGTNEDEVLYFYENELKKKEKNE